jgi:hypothetical protein
MITILQGRAEERIKEIPDSSIHLTNTSCPYSDQRHYAEGHDYDFPTIATELYRVTCDGGIVAWNEGLSCRKSDEESTPYEHVLGFKAAGFKLLQTVIIKKDSIPFPGRYRCVLLAVSKGRSSKGLQQTGIERQAQSSSWPDQKRGCR